MGGQASKDPELSQKGFEEAEALGMRLSKDFKRRKAKSLVVVSSPMRRCLLTIRPAIHHLGLAKDECFCHGACFEYACAGTAYQGSHFTELEEHFPEFQLTGFNADGLWDYRGSNEKENERDAAQRANRIVDWLRGFAEYIRSNDRSGKPVILMTIHQTLADVILHILVNGSSKDWAYGDINFRLRNAGFTEIFLEANGNARLGKQNDFTHCQDMQSPQQSPLRQTAQIVKLRDKFAKHDKSGDRKLNLMEMGQLLRKGDPTMSDDEVTRLFEEADRDYDGEVDFDEFVEYLYNSDLGS